MDSKFLSDCFRKVCSVGSGEPEIKFVWHIFGNLYKFGCGETGQIFFWNVFGTLYEDGFREPKSKILSDYFWEGTLGWLRSAGDTLSSECL